MKTLNNFLQNIKNSYSDSQRECHNVEYWEDEQWRDIHISFEMANEYIEELKNQLDALMEVCKIKDNIIREQNRQIEKMRNCMNCKDSYCEDSFGCARYYNECRGDNYSKWRLAE